MSSLTQRLSQLLVVSAVCALPQDFVNRGSFVDGGSSGGFIDGGVISGGSSGSFISGGSSGGFISGGSSGGAVIRGSSGGFISGGSSSGGFVSGGGASGGEFITVRDSGCSFGEARDASGNCVKARVTKSLYLFGGAPDLRANVIPAGRIPEAKIHYNYVFIKAPEVTGGSTPVVGPVPQQKTIVYVLAKNPETQQQQVVELEADPVRPDVFFVRHDGVNLERELPGGISLRQALAQAEQTGQVIELGSSGASGSVGGGLTSGQVFSSGSSGQIVGGGSISGGSLGGQIISGGSLGSSLGGSGLQFIGSGGNFAKDLDEDSE